MARNLNPKCKQCRRTGEKLLLKGERCTTAKCAIIKRNYAPGFHGPKTSRRLSGYAHQLNEKQKAKKQYHLMEKQFKLIFDRAQRTPGNAGENFLKFLEMRLDNAIYRIGFAASRPQARQLVSHGLITVNNRKVTAPSFTVKTGDEIKIKDNKKQVKLFNSLSEKLKNKEVPGWINLNAKEVTAKVLHQPDTGSLQPNFDVQMIIEYYSR